MLKNSRVLITGGAGLVASHIAAAQQVSGPPLPFSGI
jgi:nucleoside-diphosphate-sugar epimerase